MAEKIAHFAQNFMLVLFVIQTTALKIAPSVKYAD